jgi:hypothetical protein
LVLVVLVGLLDVQFEAFRLLRLLFSFEAADLLQICIDSFKDFQSFFKSGHKRMALCVGRLLSC